MAFPFTLLAALGDKVAVHDDVQGTRSVVVFWSTEDESAVAFRPWADDQQLTFEVRDAQFFDVETGSAWTMAGKAISGPLIGFRPRAGFGRLRGVLVRLGDLPSQYRTPGVGPPPPFAPSAPLAPSDQTDHARGGHIERHRLPGQQHGPAARPPPSHVEGLIPISTQRYERIHDDPPRGLGVHDVDLVGGLEGIQRHHHVAVPAATIRFDSPRAETMG